MKQIDTMQLIEKSGRKTSKKSVTFLSPFTIYSFGKREQTIQVLFGVRTLPDCPVKIVGKDSKFSTIRIKGKGRIAL